MSDQVICPETGMLKFSIQFGIFFFSYVSDVVVKTAKKLLRIPDEVPVSLVTQYPDPKHIPLDSRESLEELGLYCNQSIIVESNFLFGKPR